MKALLAPRALVKLQERLLNWYGRHRRAFPWRASRNPHRIWVAEIMLQQTRIAAVLSYYRRFLERFPTVRSLAQAREEQVVQAWSGLGYYSRARNLHRAAKEIVQRHNGRFPRTLAEALELPGVGRYTAAAVLSIAHGVPLAALDGNVARVLARLGAVRGDLRAPRRWRQLEETAHRLLAVKAPGDWNQALMELGETLCTPQMPRCELCPLSRWCLARVRGLTSSIPAPRRKRAPVRVRIAAAILRDPRGRTLLVRDPGAHDHVLFSRLWQFPAVEVLRNPEKELAAYLRTTFGLNGPRLELEARPAARHGVTFRHVTLLPFLIHVPRLPKGDRTRVVPLGEIRRLPISSATRKLAAAVTDRRR